jgi:hypothetical protein
VNQLAVLGVGDRFTLYINNEYVGTVSDSRISEGRVGVTVGLGYAGQEALFRFDNFVLLIPPP